MSDALIDVMYPISTPVKAEIGKWYYHVASGNAYQVIGIGIYEPDLSQIVLYKGPNPNAPIWARPRTVFEDGRFQLMPTTTYSLGA